MEYQRTKDFLLCIDSDGCAMDAMDIKHIKAFGPCLIEEWDLVAYEDILLPLWNDINLYKMTRGINRFKGLVLFLEEVDKRYQKIEGLDSLQQWVSSTKELSEKSLLEEINKGEKDILNKALSWSRKVNARIRSIPKEAIKPFDGVLAYLTKASADFDIAIVSSANREAVKEEWERYGLLPLVNILMAQDMGTKKDCISKLLTYGYQPKHCMMIGDAKGDMEAADANGIHFYPILVGKETWSWEKLGEVSDALCGGSFGQEMQEYWKKLFFENLGGEDG